MPSARRFCLGACALSVTALSTPRDALSCVRFLAQGLGGQLPGGGEGRADARREAARDVPTPVILQCWAQRGPHKHSLSAGGRKHVPRAGPDLQWLRPCLRDV